MVGASTWAIVPQEIGEPISLEISSEIPCMSLRIASATLVRMAPRSAGAMWGQGPWSKAWTGGGHRPLDVGDLRLGDPPDQLLGGRGDHIEHGRGRRLDPLPSDKQAIV